MVKRVRKKGIAASGVLFSGKLIVRENKNQNNLPGRSSGGKYGFYLGFLWAPED
jgi:hypothetical protein